MRMRRILIIQFFLCIIWTLIFVLFISRHSDSLIVLLVIVAFLMYQVIFCLIMTVANKLVKINGHRLMYIPLVLFVISIFIFDRKTFYYFGGLCVAGVVSMVNKGLFHGLMERRIKR